MPSLEEEPRNAVPRTAEPEPNELLQHLEIEVELKNTGRTRTINGFDARETVMSITAHEKGKTLDESGGLALTSSMWLAPKIPALKELNAFDQRYARKLAGAIFGGSPEHDPSASPSAVAAHPMLKDVLVRMRAEGAKVEGSPILTTMTVDSRSVGRAARRATAGPTPARAVEASGQRRGWPPRRARQPGGGEEGRGAGGEAQGRGAKRHDLQDDERGGPGLDRRQRGRFRASAGIPPGAIAATGCSGPSTRDGFRGGRSGATPSTWT